LARISRECFHTQEIKVGKLNTYNIIIDYNANWTGSIGDETGQRSINGNGPTEINVKGGIVVAVIQKSDDSSDTLTVQIREGNKILETQYTSSEYGVVSVSHSF